MTDEMIPGDDITRANEGWEPQPEAQEPLETRDEEQESLPFAAEQVLSAAELLDRDDDHQLTLTEVMEAQARALTSIAATMLDLHALIEDEVAWRRSQRPAEGTEVEESDEQESAHRSLGPTEDPGFSFTGR